VLPNAVKFPTDPTILSWSVHILRRPLRGARTNRASTQGRGWGQLYGGLSGIKCTPIAYQITLFEESS
jgi:hypothetical protein